MYVPMNLLSLVLKILPAHPVYAHCDIPCGIYDPYTTQVAAHTVVRMTKLLEEYKDDNHQVARITKVKEEHAEIVRHEVQVIWSDYFKPEMLEKYPDLHTEVWNLLKLASKAKQKVDPVVASQLLEAVQKFAETFYESKGLEPLRIPSGFPTEGGIVTHK